MNDDTRYAHSVDRHARYNSGTKGRARRQRHEALAARRAYRAAWMREHRRQSTGEPERPGQRVNDDTNRSVNDDARRVVCDDDAPATQEPDYDGGPPHDQ